MSKVNLPSGNMYQWCRTWNPWEGECPHRCKYCFARRHRFPVLKAKYSGPMRLGQLDANLYRGGTEKVVFVGSMTDPWADGVPAEVIQPVLEYCNQFPENTYLFQSKNPRRFYGFRRYFPPKTILGTTIESNWAGEYSLAPDPAERALALLKINGFPKMVSVEPIMRFNHALMVMWLRLIKPEFISIGADSKGNDLPEPSPNYINQLILACGQFTIVKTKANLRRLGVAESLLAEE